MTFKEDAKYFVKTLLLVPGVIIGYHLLHYYIFDNQLSNTIPRDRKIQTGFVKTSKLEIELKDLDKDGKNETLMNYDGKLYLLKIDSSGKPIIQSYEIEPIKIIPQH